MIIIPAIDIRGGMVVRLFQGDYNKEKAYSQNPSEVAKKWADAGAKMIHVVDLDGARSGKPINLEILEGIVNGVNVPIQMGGGLRSIDDIERILSLGVKRVVLGTKAFDEKFLKEIIKRFGASSIVVGIDSFGDNVQVEGWLTKSGYNIKDTCEHVIKCGIENIIFTDIKSDGTLSGPNFESLKILISYPSLNVIVSGGIGSLDDIKKINSLGVKNITGIIIGKALYEDVISFKDAMNIVT